MYKQLIYAVVAMLIGGAAYYFHQAGVPDLIASGNDDRRGNGVSAMQVFSGTYVCTEESGCETPTKLVLEEDTTLDIIETVNGQDVPLGQGTWGIGSGGAIVMVLRNPGNVEGDYPSSLIANKVSSIKITGFSKKKPLFKGMTDPVFTRIKTEKDAITQQPIPAENEESLLPEDSN